MWPRVDKLRVQLANIRHLDALGAPLALLDHCSGSRGHTESPKLAEFAASGQLM